jgi:excisionase family DNA binding protein
MSMKKTTDDLTETVLLRSGEAAQKANVCRETIIRWYHEGKIRAIKTGKGQLLFTPAEIERVKQAPK